MPKLTPNARAADNARVIRSVNDARKLCRGDSLGWQSARAAVLHDHSQPCHVCLGAIRWDLKGPHPLSPSVDHLPGHRVEDQLGKTVGEARRILHDIDGMRPSHFGCNARDNRGAPRMPTPTPEPPTQSKDEPSFVFRKPDLNAVTIDGVTYHRGPNTAEIFEDERRQFADYEKDYRRECGLIGAKPPALSDADWSEWKSEVRGAA